MFCSWPIDAMYFKKNEVTLFTAENINNVLFKAEGKVFK